MEYTRVCFYTEYYEKYKDLLSWRKSELENGEKTLERAKKYLMKPNEILQTNIYIARLDNGDFSGVPPIQYELPVMPNDVNNIINDKLSETRIDPQILTPIYDPFRDQIKSGTTRKSVANRNRQSSTTSHNINNPSISMTISKSISMSKSMSMSPSNQSPFTDDLHSQKIFARTQRNYNFNISNNNNNINNINNAPFLIPQTKSDTIIDDYESDKDIKPILPSRSKSTNVNTPKKANKPSKPVKPPPSLNDFKQQIESQKKNKTKKINFNNHKPPPLPTRNNGKKSKKPRQFRAKSDTLNTIKKKRKNSNNNKPKLPKRSVDVVAEQVRKGTLESNPPPLPNRAPKRTNNKHNNNNNNVPNIPHKKPPKHPPKPGKGPPKRPPRKINNDKWY